MSTAVFLAVLTAALLHATWNALVKSSGDKLLNMTAVVLGQGLTALVILPFVPVPDMASAGYLAAGIILHIGYQLFLISSYRMGDFTQVYPIARGTAPLLVAAVSVLFLGVHLDRIELLAVAIIGLGIMSLSIVRQKDGARNMRAAGFAVATGCFIASYSLVDGLGGRVAGTGVGFYAWLAIGNGVAFAVFAALRHPGTLARVPRQAKLALIGGGSASFAAYALVVWSFTHAPIALVTAARETSIIFALLIGVFFMKERLDLMKVISTMITLSGVALLRLSKH